MKDLEWVIGLLAGIGSGMCLRVWIRGPSVSRIKDNLKKEGFYHTGRNQYKDIQATKEKMRLEAQKNLMTERGTL
ncbi:hypothetical protein SAMN05192559_101821 [Halobacillus karajensis]|uniref:Uncharacterized protein n=1 Tax=Halobacillus karajensis TaxID=195088 RepID=A0A059NYQ0_9BACI|nr:hypothetical protein [Halobacillus karajensis]CDQ18567.1 hypothetical protein BN982_00841 [Halobacillus karajensis]CDQ23361.1 hypothetical protein BN983_01587 [Halobacillus karajensis]CDQ26843.1 hypothetical protein BN981_01067 [Halobacillus karajensis]SEH49811.1 hypothetical protein SAMN05192559_101821 [Halobacillus karajensis]